MFVRRKPNKSGSTSIQVIDKSSGKYTVVKTIGNSKSASQLEKLEIQAKDFISSFTKQTTINFSYTEEAQYIDTIYQAIDTLHLVGPELVIGKIFDEIGFNKITDEMFRHLVISRVCFPASKLRTVDYLYRYKGLMINVQRVYRYMDKLNSTQKDTIQQISYNHTLQISEGTIQIVFYDVTTLYFETDTRDNLRKPGFSKEGRHSNPQILLGLLISSNGDPLAYEIFEGNKYEGATMLPVIEIFIDRFKLKKIIIVADAGLLTEKNISKIKSLGYEYIIGARIKNEKVLIREKILSLKLKSGEAAEIEKFDGSRLIISYSDKRAKKDESNRMKGIAKLEKKICSGKLTKSNINNKGYNKFLAMEGQISVQIDYDKITAEKCWDGLKGYTTNTELTIDETIKQYGNLWNIEKAFRIAKSDLRIRPIYHRLQKRIEAHIAIAFCAYKIYKELERQLKSKSIALSVEKAIDIANTIYKISFTTPISKSIIDKVIIKNELQKELLKIL